MWNFVKRWLQPQILARSTSAWIYPKIYWWHFWMLFKHLWTQFNVVILVSNSLSFIRLQISGLTKTPSFNIVLNKSENFFHGYLKQLLSFGIILWNLAFTNCFIAFNFISSAVTVLVLDQLNCFESHSWCLVQTFLFIHSFYT